MSRIYWHAKNRTAELNGSERAWLNHVASGPATVAWDLDRSLGLERAAQILALVPEVPDCGHGENYLHRYLREAQEQHTRNMAERRLISAIKVALRVQELPLKIAGVNLNTSNVGLNTALVAGSDPVRLAAKIHGWCESHCWIEGPDREWAADIIGEGLHTGIYRRGLWYVDRPCDGLPEDQPDRKWSDQGWADVLALLRGSDDGPVVLSYSVCDGFPNRDIAGWQPPPMPDGWMPRWADTDAGRAEWEESYPTLEDKAACYRDTAYDQWGDLPADEQWDRAMEGLRSSRPWARLAPDTLTDVSFHWPVTVYDLFAPDRDERIRRAVEASDDGTS